MPLPLALPLIGLAVKAAPWLLNAVVGDKVGGVVDKIINAGKQIFGPNADKMSEAELNEKIATDPKKWDAWTAAINADLEEFRLQVQDVQAARKHTLDLAALAEPPRNTRANLMLSGAFVALLTIIFLLFLYRNSMPETVLNVFMLIIGAVTTWIGSAFNYEFGSSRGSEAKTAMMSMMQPGTGTGKG